MYEFIVLLARLYVVTTLLRIYKAHVFIYIVSLVGTSYLMLLVYVKCNDATF